MKYWKIVAGRGAEAIDDFKENGRIGLGFTDSKEAEQVTNVADMRALVAREYPNAPAGRVVSWGSQLYKFYRDIQVDDVVLVYEPSTRLYHVGRILSEAKCVNKGDLPHQRKVKWETTLLRDDLSTSTRNTLGAILALFEITGSAREEIESRLTGKTTEIVGNQDVNVAEEGVDELGEDVYERSQEFIKDAIIRLDWQQVQELVAGLLRAMGYKTRVSPAGADRGKDIIASPDGLGLEDPRIVVEVKHRPNSQMGAPEIRAHAGGLRNAKGLYVSTGGFSKEAYYEAERAQAPMMLLDIDELGSLIIQYYEQFDVDAKALLPLRKMYWPIR